MNSKRKIVSVLVAACAVFCFCTQPARAEAVSVEATVDRKTVELGSYLQMSLTVKGVKHVDPVTLPQIDGFQTRYLGPSTRMSIVNGVYSNSTSFMYNLYPDKVGQFQVPAISLEIDGVSYETQPISINVVASQQTALANEGSGAQATSLQDKIFLIMGTTQDRYYLGQKVPLTIKLLVNDLQVRDVQYPEFDHKGFMVEGYLEPRRYQQTVNGTKYEVVEFRTFIYPTRTGELSLGPAKLNCNLLMPNSSGGRRRSSQGFESLFSDDFFNNFFQTYVTRPIALESHALPVQVTPLPEEGKPAGFQGAVGNFTFEASVSPKEVKVGDPLTIRMKLSGEGNLKSVEMPEFKANDDFKFYEPQITQQAGEKILEQVAIPKNSAIDSFPKIVFSFFDPVLNEYKTTSAGPFPIAVKQLDQEDQLKVVGLGRESGSLRRKEKIGHDIVYIKEMPGRFYPVGYRIHQGWLYRAILMVVFLLEIGLYILYRLTHRLKTDQAFARKFAAPKNARKGLSKAKKLLAAGQSAEFHDTLFKTLQSYLADKLHLKAGGVTLAAIIPKINESALPDPVAADLKSVFEECEMVRYAAVSISTDKMNALFERVQRIIDLFERRWK